MTIWIALLVATGLGAANFAYQGLTAQDWAIAIERTWFQTTACLVMVGVDYTLRRSVGGA